MALIKKFRIKSFKSDENIVEIKNTSVFYNKRQILNNLNLNIKKQEILGMLGPNGVGKSTIFNLITGLKDPNYGKIFIEGFDVTNLPINERFLKFKLGFVPQYGGLIHDLTLLYLGYGVLGGMGIGFGYLGPLLYLQSWFPDRRGLAAGLAVAGFGGGSIAIAPVISKLLSTFREAPTYVGRKEDFVTTLNESGERFVKLGEDVRVYYYLCTFLDSYHTHINTQVLQVVNATL